MTRRLVVSAALVVLVAVGCSSDKRPESEAAPPQERPPADVVALVDGILSPDGERIFYAAHPRILDKAEFDTACPNDSEFTVVLGCYHRGTISVLRVDRPDLAPVMTVTAVHEMLHAAYADLPKDERARIDAQVQEFYAGLNDPEIRDVVGQYDRREPGQRANELHSILPTEVASLSPPLERYFRRYFADRSRVVQAHDGYAAVFRNLERRVADLHAQIGELKRQLETIEGRMNADRRELESLNARLDRLRAQGDIAEYNSLVPRQNALVSSYNGMVDQFNNLVDRHNARVDEVNALALQQDELVTSLGSKPSLPPA